MARVTQLNVNGSMLAVDADADASLLWVLRDQLDLTGSKYGCGEGQCGACTVLINGSPRRSCITAVGAVRDRQITTIEGLAKGEHLHPVQQCFLDQGGDAMCVLHFGHDHDGGFAVEREPESVGGARFGISWKATSADAELIRALWLRCGVRRRLSRNRNPRGVLAMNDD